MNSPKKYCWNFVVDQKGGHKGFNNPDLERFKNGRYRSLTREVIQNSIDAQANKEKPVRVEFENSTQKVSDLPDRDGLLKKVSACIPMAARDISRKDALPWFENAKSILEGTSLEVLRMSDYNTSGMAGPCEYGYPFYAYMKAMGASEKPDSTAAGSHGIGKRAPLLSSKLRTIVAVTKYLNKPTNTVEFLTQGFSLLITHQEVNETGKIETIDHEGYWGIPDGCLPSSDPSSIPEWMSRDEIGTNLFLLGFDKSNNWKEKMVAMAMTHFFAAFSRGTLEVKIQDILINKETIHTHFNDILKYKACLDDNQEIIDLEFAKYFLEAIQEGNPEVKLEQSEIPHLGLVEICVLVREGLPQEYALVRSNMLIMRSLPGLKRFPNYKDFVAVIECKSAEGIKLLRSIEPSRHDSFEIDQLESDQEKQNARYAINKLSDFIRKTLKKYAQEVTQEAGTIDFLSQFLADEASPGGETSEIEKDPKGKIQITPKRISYKSDRLNPLIPGGGGGSGGTNPGKGTKGGTDGVNPGKGTGSRGEPIKNLAQQARVIETRTGRHVLSFTITKSGAFNVSLRAVGLDSEEKLEITETSFGNVRKGRVVVVLGDEVPKRISMEVLLDRPSLGTYRVVCEEIIL